MKQNIYKTIYFVLFLIISLNNILWFSLYDKLLIEDIKSTNIFNVERRIILLLVISTKIITSPFIIFFWINNQINHWIKISFIFFVLLSLLSITFFVIFYDENI